MGDTDPCHFVSNWAYWYAWTRVWVSITEKSSMLRYSELLTLYKHKEVFHTAFICSTSPVFLTHTLGHKGLFMQPVFLSNWWLSLLLPLRNILKCWVYKCNTFKCILKWTELGWYTCTNVKTLQTWNARLMQQPEEPKLICLRTNQLNDFDSGFNQRKTPMLNYTYKWQAYAYGISFMTSIMKHYIQWSTAKLNLMLKLISVLCCLN